MVKIASSRFQATEWMGTEDFPFAVPADRLVVGVSRQLPGGVTLSIRGEYSPHDDPEGVALELEAESARRLAATLLVIAARSERLSRR